MARQMEGGTPDGAAFLDSLSDDELALFAEALAIQRELEAEDAAAAGVAAPLEGDAEEEERLVRALKGESPAPMVVEPAHAADEERISGVVPMPRRARRISRAWMGVAAAAVIAVVAVPFLRRSGAGLGEPAGYVALLSDQNAVLPEDIDNRPWEGTRGNGDTPPELRNAAQVGAYVVDLQIAIAGNDTRVSLFAERAADAVGKAPGTAGAEAARLFRELGTRAGAGPEVLRADFAAAADAAEDAVDEDRFALGGWAEAARVAAKRRDAAFFRTDDWRASLDRAERIADDPAARSAIQRVRAAAGAAAPQWKVLESAIDDLFRAIA